MSTIRFVDLSTKGLGYKTKYFVIEDEESAERLGAIKWHERYKKYAFFPNRNTMYDAVALLEIFNFITEENKTLKNGGD